MSSHPPTIGRCPRCETRLHRTRLLIEYDTVDGPAAYATCPDCEDVVSPV